MAGRIRVPVHDQESVLSPTNHKMVAIVRRFRGLAQEIGTVIGALEIFHPPGRPQAVQPGFKVAHRIHIAQRVAKIQGRIRTPAPERRHSRRFRSRMVSRLLHHEPDRSQPAPLAMRGPSFVGYTYLVVLVSRRYKIDKRGVEIDVM